MAAPYEAVILAAGQGSRLHEHTELMPKALLPIGPRSASDPQPTSFLRRQVELLHALGTEQIVIVVGALREMIEADVRTWDVPVTLVVNPTTDIGTSGSLHSFQFALHSQHGLMNGRRQTLMMDADIVYERRALELLLGAPERTTILVSARHADDQEEVLVYGREEQPRFLGKALSRDLVDGEPCLGEATGIVKFAPEDHSLARKTVDWMVGDPSSPEGSARRMGFGPGRRATEHEELTQRFMRYGRMHCVRFGEEVAFMECDTAEEYKRVRDSFYPRLLQLESPGART